MFTGIIETVATIEAITPMDGDVRLTVKAPNLDWSDIALGDSIATNGVCLTVIAVEQTCFKADVSAETLRLTTIGKWRAGTRVNLEKALTPQSRMGGHFVSGHVDGVGEIVAREAQARSEKFTCQVPQQLAKYIALKGSITVDGTSLTVNTINSNRFEINIVPHTLDKTLFGDYRPGTLVNLEVDIIARYLERLLQVDGEAGQNSKQGLITKNLLVDNGYMDTSKR